MIHKTLKALAFLTVCIITIFSFAQTGNCQSQKIAPALLRQDFLLLRDTLQKIHPGLYVYKNKTTIDNMFDSCFSAIKDSMTVTDFYALTSFVIASIGDGHTNCRLSNQFLNDYYSSIKVFPAMVMFINNRAFIFCCKQNTELTETELLSINNHSLKEIVRTLFKYIQSDGFIQSHKNWELPENFQLLFNILYGVSNSYNVTYKTKSGEIKNTILQADIIKNVFCTSPFPRPLKYLQLTYQPGNIAVLTIKSFYNDLLQQTGENFSTFLDSAFTDIKNKKAERLLIDIRSNQGGNDENGELLYSYLTSKPFMYYATQATVDGVYTSVKHPELALQQPKENNFKGKVFILVNGRS
ncbi:MAG TPA: S41 family peptidase, partial [Parafilimonas sp.]